MTDRWRDFPFAPARFPIFYGWVIVLVGAVGIMMSTPGQTMGVAVFTDPLLDALHISRVQLSAAYMVGTILSAFMLPYAGKLYDKLGPRSMGPLAGLSLVLVLVLLSRIDSVSETLSRLTGVEGALVPFVIMCIAFCALRFTAQGVLTLTSSSMIMQWFDRRRGIANSITGTIAAFGFSGAPIILRMFIEEYGWSGAWLVMAAIVGVIFVPLALAFYRDKPENFGLIPDGKVSSDEETRSESPVVREYTAGEARRTFSFWVVAMTLSMAAFYSTGLTFHLISIFGEAGFSAEIATTIFLPGAVIAVSLHIVGGWLSDRVKIKHLLVFMLIGQLITMWGFITLSPGLSYWAVIVGNGMNHGMFALLSAITWPKYFGRKHLGSIMGLNMSLVVFHSALGPFLFSQSFALTGGYQAAGIACLIGSIALLVGASRADNPQTALSIEMQNMTGNTDTSGVKNV